MGHPAIGRVRWLLYCANRAPERPLKRQSYNEAKRLVLQRVSFTCSKAVSIFVLGCNFALALHLCTSANAQQNLDRPKFVLPPNELSQQSSRPFSINGHVIDRQNPRWDQYESALAIFPTTQSCLQRSSKTQWGWNLAAIEWAAMTNNSDIEVCLFRIADSFGSPERMRSWLNDQGYVGSDFVSQPYDLNQIAKSEDTWMRVEGYLPASTFYQRVHFNSSIWDWLLRVPPSKRDHFVNIGFSKIGKVIFVFSGRRGT